MVVGGFCLLNLPQKKLQRWEREPRLWWAGLKEREKQPRLIGVEQDQALNETERQLQKHSSLLDTLTAT